MNKRNKIIYWIATVWLALGMVSTGMVQLMGNEQEESFMKDLGYPHYFMVLLGVWKILGAIAILIPGYPRLKEWAYAGFFFVMTGAAFSHVASNTVNQIFPSLLLLALTLVSWYFRPANRKLISVNFSQ
jgi:uncharacterized membrane protein YphA (DoxX/SURF4 family)